MVQLSELVLKETNWIEGTILKTANQY